MQQHVTLLPGLDQQLFALGLKWKRSIGASTSDGASEARKVASAAKSTHMLLDRATSGKVRMVGHGNLGKKAPPKVLSLAAAFARMFQNNQRAVVALKLRSEGVDEPPVWLCAVADGMVVPGTDVVLQPSEVGDRVDELMERFTKGSMEVWGDESLNMAQPITLAELMGRAVQAEASCKLEKVGFALNIPKPMLYGVILLAVVVAGKTVLQKVRENQLAKQREAQQLARSEDPSPEEAWKSAVNKWVSVTADVAPPEALTDLFGTLGRLGLDVANWKLESVECNRKMTSWGCAAVYKRDEERRADSASFAAALPKGWTPTWTGIDGVKVAFSVPCRNSKFDLRKAPLSNAAQMTTLMHLQRYSKAFSTHELGDFAAEPIVMPKRSDGQPYTIDPKLMHPLVVSATLKLAGPLRSVFTLMDLPVSFDSIKLKVASDIEPTVSASALQVEELKGKIYAVQ